MRQNAAILITAALTIALATSEGASLLAEEPLRANKPTAQDKPPQSDTIVDPTGEFAWLEHDYTNSQRDSLRDAFAWGIENQFIPGGSLLIIHRGETVFREGFGVADLETKQPFSVDAPCRIASVTKPHTATLIAFLVDQGKLHWDDSVDKYLPPFAQARVRGKGLAKRAPKIRELLSHSAGFPGNDEIKKGPVTYKLDGTLAQAVDELAKAELINEPGTRFAYTGLGYMVAGRIAEIVTGQEFNALMREQLLKPIGATTAVFHSAASKDLLSRIPTMYERQAGKLVKVDIATRTEAGAKFPMPGGGLVSTLDEVSQLLLFHRNHGVVAGKPLVAANTLHELYRPQRSQGGNGYGLGFNVMRTDTTGIGSRIRHTGASGTLAVLDFKLDLIVVMLTQVPTRQTQPFGNRLTKAIDSVFPAQ